MENIGFTLKTHHVGFFVSKLEPSIEWWEKMLGFKLVHLTVNDLPGAGITRMCWIYNGEVYIELYEYDREMKPFSPEDYLGSLGTKHICLYASHSEFHVMRKHLLDNKANLMVDCRWPDDQSAEVVQPLGPDANPETTHGVIYICDPDGIVIELQEEYYPGVGRNKE